ncbi:MAG TPA: NUDIX hydrolase, partial [Corynebacterium falsenii]|nr:NUDIX hydrolase [Corynebacterium falsenii]
MASHAEDLYRVSDSDILFDGPIIAVRKDTISTPTGSATREIVEHFSAVAIAAVREGRIMMIRQYRHGVGRYLWEIPAGLLDKV